MVRHRRPNWRSVKIHRSYSIDEISRLLKVHKNTVRAWIKRGLPAIDSKRPILINGLDLSGFLVAERNKGKQYCGPGRFYCVRCRAPKAPALRMADYISFSATSGTLQGLCPDCGTLINRRVSLARVDEIRGDLDITFPQAVQRLTDSP
jgi:hypothetical protein